MRILIWSPNVSMGGGIRLLANLLPAMARQEDIEFVRLVISPQSKFKERINTQNCPNIDIIYSDESIESEIGKKFYMDCHVVYFFWPHNQEHAEINRPSICTFHDTTILDFVPQFVSGNQLKQYWENSKIWLEKCTSVVVSSNYVKSRLVAHAGDHLNSVYVIPHAISPILHNVELATNSELASRLPSQYFVYPANTSPHKNHYNLLLAYSRFAHRKKYPLVLFGSLTELLRNVPPNWPETPSIPTLVSLIKRVGLRIDEDLFPMGFITDQDVTPIIKNASALIMPSLSEGGGSYPVEEALRLGVPVLCSDIPVMREHLANHTAEVAWLNPESPDSIRQALDDMVNHYDYYKESTLKGMNDPSQTWDDIAMKYIQVFRLAYLTYHGKNSMPLNENQSNRTQIGIFLGYQGRVIMDGEGIGRYVVRLAEGLLRNSTTTSVHISTNPDNIQEVQKIFQKLTSLYSDRLIIHNSSNVDWINKNVPVEVWIVPYVGLELALQLEKPIVLCLHDLVYLHFKKMYDRAYPEFVKRIDPIVRAMTEKASSIVFSSNYIREHEGFKFLKLPKEKTHVIRLAAPAEEYQSFEIMEEQFFRDKYKLYGDYMVYPSAIRLHKNHDRLIEAFLKFKHTPEGSISNLQLVLSDHYIQSPMKAEIIKILYSCKDIDIRKSIVFLGRLPSSDIPSLYQYAVGTIVPTLFEGSCPFPILESLIMNTQVAFSEIEVAKEVISNLNSFITFDPYSVNEIEKAIHLLWRNKNTIIEEQKAVLSEVLQRKWSDVADEYLALIKKIINRG